MSDNGPPYFVIKMPLNAEGKGPECDPAKVVKNTWEIWDSCNMAVSVHETSYDAWRALKKLYDSRKVQPGA
jgi:hypothetical protein